MKKSYFHQKLEALNKGLKGDWQKEGHSFSHFFENDSEPGFKVLQIESHKDGNRSGFWRFSYIPHQKDDKRSKYTNHTVDDAYTYPEHQRKGLATHAYSLSEKILGSKVDSMEGPDPKRPMVYGLNLTETSANQNQIKSKKAKIWTHLNLQIPKKKKLLARSILKIRSSRLKISLMLSRKLSPAQRGRITSKPQV